MGEQRERGSAIRVTHNDTIAIITARRMWGVECVTPERWHAGKRTGGVFVPHSGYVALADRPGGEHGE